MWRMARVTQIVQTVIDEEPRIEYEGPWSYLAGIRVSTARQGQQRQTSRHCWLWSPTRCGLIGRFRPKRDSACIRVDNVATSASSESVRRTRNRRRFQSTRLTYEAECSGKQSNTGNGRTYPSG